MDQNSVILIDYRETLDIIKSYLSQDHRESGDIKEILMCLLMMFFRERDTETQFRLNRLLEDNYFSDFENSEISQRIYFSIIDITNRYFPRFRSYLQEHTFGQHDLTMHNSTTLALIMNKSKLKMITDSF